MTLVLWIGVEPITIAFQGNRFTDKLPTTIQRRFKICKNSNNI